MTEVVNEKLLEERLVALEGARQWSPRVVSRLEAVIRSGKDDALFRINPVKFAADKSLAETEAIDLFLHAAAVGLFEMNHNKSTTSSGWWPILSTTPEI
jgi:ribulose 1,5-bisphosphate carboxylase large subunit-like protein